MKAVLQETLKWLREGIRATKKFLTINWSGSGVITLVPAPGPGKTLTVYFLSFYSLNGDVCIFRSGLDEVFRIATLKAMPQGTMSAPIALNENAPLTAQLTTGGAATANIHYEILKL